MANLQKVVKLTQAQYNTLKSGGTVGSYTGLDDNYIYLIEDTNTYITSDGGTIDGGELFLDDVPLKMIDLNGIYFEDGHGNVILAINYDQLGSEIIYNSHSNYKPLFADSDYALIYSDNNDYWSDFTFSTKQLRVYDADDTKNTIYFDTETHEIGHSEGSGSNWYSAVLPSASGTLALTSDIINVVANPGNTTGILSSIQIGNTKYAIQGGVTDVKINNVSILNGTIANFATKTAYNASTNQIAPESDLPQIKRYI